MGEVVSLDQFRAARQPRETIFVADQGEVVCEAPAPVLSGPPEIGAEVHNMTTLDCDATVYVVDVVSQDGDTYTIVDRMGLTHKVERDGKFWITV